jgi:hypothetical protein
MISSHRIHQEYIKRVEQSLKAPYLIRKAEPCMDETSSRVRTQIKRPKPAVGASIIQRQKFPGEGWKTSDLASNNSLEVQLFTPQSSTFPVIAVKCIRCGSCMPIMDFLYTKKTGLCISCWEDQEE